MIEDKASGKSDTGKFPAVGLEIDMTSYIESLTPEQLKLVKGILNFKAIRNYDWRQTEAQYLISAKQDPGVGQIVRAVLAQIPLLEALERRYGHLDAYFSSTEN